ncbi:MAG: site-specific DNA-methyltransferase [Bacteroidetes bacterium]|nr:site-specific DNA-methyltransferase [Bacteroidota bacterium]
MAEIEKLPLTSLDIKAHQLERLKEIFPEAFTEGSKVDWDKLRLTLGEAVDTGKERYGMNWPGKSECFKTIQQPSIATLVPAREESVDFDTTQNLFIEGDNLEVLKLLQKSYLGKVKMIYIDPPYNTGKDFVYPDDYSENLDTYLAYTGQVDAEGKKFSTNTDTDGRYHSRWMNMMYPRLFLAKNLLTNNGVIFISIDNHEFDNLKKICDEIFGEENFITCIANTNNPKGRSDDKYVATAHEYVLLYKKQEITFAGWQPEEKVTRRYNKQDEQGEVYREIDLRKTGDNDRKDDRPNLFYYFLFNEETGDFYPTRDESIPSGYTQIFPQKENGELGNWRWELNTALKNKKYLLPKFMPNKKVWSVFEKDYFSPEKRIKPTSSWTDKVFNSERGSEQFIELGFKKEIFPKPKPIGLIKKILEFTIRSEDSDSIILDFFAGSCSTAHGVMEYNAENETEIKYICVQLPEKTEEDDDAFKEGYKTIADISKERIRRVIAKIKKEQKENKTLFSERQKPQDLGFKVFKLQKSNFNIWNAGVEKTPEAIQQQLFSHVAHISPEAEQEAILYELLLKSGFEVTTSIEQMSIEGKKVFSIAEGELLICLEKQLTHEVIKAIAERKPTRVICLDEGFQDNDQLKTNAVQMMKSKGVVNFRTV